MKLRPHLPTPATNPAPTSHRRRALTLLMLIAATGGALATATNPPAYADSGNKCTSTAHTSTCINITGVGQRVDWILATHHNDHPTTHNGRFRLTGPDGLSRWSPMVNYAGGHNAQYYYKIARDMPTGTYCVQWFLGTRGGAETGRACAQVHA
jgi:hypothetical protein